MPTLKVTSPSVKAAMETMDDDVWMDKGRGYWTRNGRSLKEARQDWISTRVMRVLLNAGLVWRAAGGIKKKETR